MITFFFNDTSTTEIYTLSLHDALPILDFGSAGMPRLLVQSFEFLLLADIRAKRDHFRVVFVLDPGQEHGRIQASRISQDRKSTRLNSSHLVISYAVLCLK